MTYEWELLRYQFATARYALYSWRILEVDSQKSDMNLALSIKMLKNWWQDYLLRSGHLLYSAKNPHLSQSRNGKKNRYRWLLLIGYYSKYALTESELAYINRQLKLAKKQKEAVYLVVGFVHEPRRIIVIPAKRALKVGFVRSDKGGIDWAD